MRTRQTNRALIAAAIALVALSGCSTQRIAIAPPSALNEGEGCALYGPASERLRGYRYSPRNHFFAVNETGELIEPFREDGEPETDGMPKIAFDVAFRRIADAYLDYRRAVGAAGRRVLIYLNGGLNRTRTVARQALRQVPCMLMDGYFPIFLSWPTGPAETYGEQVSAVRNGELREPPNYLTAPLHLIGDLGQGVARAPVNYVSQLNQFKDAVIHTRETLMNVRKDADMRIDPQNPAVTAVRNLYYHPQVDNAASDVGKILVYTGMTPFRLVVTPFVDPIGKSMWENMIRRTRTTIHRPAEFLETERNSYANGADEEIKRFPKGTGGFAKFFTMIEYCHTPSGKPFEKCLIEDEGDRALFREIELDLIAHSMGAIVLNEILPRHTYLPYRNIVYMAAASSIRDFARSVPPLLDVRNAYCDPAEPGAINKTACAPGEGVRFFNLMLHPLNDARELSAFGAAPAGSLLDWIDFMFEGPKTVPDRTLGKWRNVRRTKRFLGNSAQKHMLFKVFNTLNRTKDGADALIDGHFVPIKHGQFNDDRMRFWCPTFWGADKAGWRPANDGLCANPVVPSG